MKDECLFLFMNWLPLKLLKSQVEHNSKKPLRMDYLLYNHTWTGQILRAIDETFQIQKNKVWCSEVKA